MRIEKTELDRLNNYLAKDYGYFDGFKPNYRIVYSQDELEKRSVMHDDRGNELLQPIVVLRPKYRQYIHGKYILEVLIPAIPGITTDRVEELDYEPLWVFEGAGGVYLPPHYGVCKFVIATRHMRMGQGETYTRNEDPRLDKDYLLKKKQELDEIKEYLFGNETPVGDALAHGHGVGYTGESKIKDVVH